MDRRTLFSVQAGLLLFLGCVILLAFRKERRERNDHGGQWFGAGFLCAGLGLALQSERGVWPPFVTILLGNSIFMLFSALVNRAVVTTTRQRGGEFYGLLTLNALTTANYAWFTYWHPNVLVRTVEAALVLAVMNGSVVFRLLRANDPVIRPALRALAALLSFQIGTSLLRIGLAWHLKQADAWFSWIGIITIAGLALSFLWIDGLRLRHQLEQSAMTDPLTGLLNRRGLEMLAEPALLRTARANDFCSALMLDLDHFKAINDRHGHAVGDTCLTTLAGTLRDTLRKEDLVTRLGGDEFFVLLPDTGMDAAALVCVQLREAFQQIQVQVGNGDMLTLSVSIGQATRHAAHVTLSELLRVSDAELYREKQNRSARWPETAPSLLLFPYYEGALVQSSLA